MLPCPRPPTTTVGALPVEDRKSLIGSYEEEEEEEEEDEEEEAEEERVAEL